MAQRVEPEARGDTVGAVATIELLRFSDIGDRGWTIRLLISDTRDFGICAKYLDFRREFWYFRCMFSHFFSRNWFAWTATKYLQAHIERAITVPKPRAITPPDVKIARQTPATSRPKDRANRQFSPVLANSVNVPRPEVRSYSAPAPNVFRHTPNRPAAVKANGGLRGSTATRWR